MFPQLPWPAYFFGAVLVWIIFFYPLTEGSNQPVRESKSPGRSLNISSAYDEVELGKHFLVFTPWKRPKFWQRLSFKKVPDPVILGEEARFLHTQILGASGTGKTHFAIYPFAYQDIRRGAGCIFFDPKSNMHPTLSSYASEHGRQGDYLDIDIAEPTQSLTYSPLLGDDADEIANRVHTALYQDDRTATAFYRDDTLSFFRNFFGLCQTLAVLPTLAQLMDCAADQSQMARFISLAPESAQGKFLAQRYLSLHRKDFLQLFSGCVNKLAPLAQGPFASVINTSAPDVILSDVIQQGRILHWGLAADRYPRDYKALSTMALMDLQSCLTRRYAGRARPVFVYLDEFGDLAYPHFRSLISKAREARVGIVIAHQAQGDLLAWGAAFTDSVFTSTSNKIIFRLGSPETADQIARLVGTKAIHGSKVSYAVRDGQTQARSITPTEGYEFLAHPNLLKNLGIGEALMVVQRQGGREFHHGPMRSAPARSAPSFRPLALGQARHRFKPLVLPSQSPEPRPWGPAQAKAQVQLSGRKPRAS